MACKHDMIRSARPDFKYCPFCGEKIVSDPEYNLKRYRKAEKHYERQGGESYGFGCGNLIFSGLWRMAQNIYTAETGANLTVNTCPDDAVERVMDILIGIEADFKPLLEKYS